MKKISYKIYQSMRFYLDEYKDQSELRSQWFSSFIETVNTNTYSKITVEDFPSIDDVYFYRRWLKKR